ncbi:MAG TPA: bifunctional nuclease domain-containing protein [Candidatus Binataceae bacterium]|nr:bifunctional nuclease domain-containing protein [Candidatus Binataceae bacterium]
MWRRRGTALAAAALALALLSPACTRHAGRGGPVPGEVRVEIANVGLDNDSGAHYVQLEDPAGRRTLQILIGDEEARVIMLEMHGVKPDRPLTHDLLREVLEQTGNRVRRVVISGVRNHVYYAEVFLHRPQVGLDCRPSDAIALAMAMDAPIYVADDLFHTPAAPAPHEARTGSGLPPTLTVDEIVVQNLNPALAHYFGAAPSNGVLVAEVSGLAARAGLTSGDIVTEVDRREMHTISDFALAMADCGRRDIRLSVMRRRQPRIVTLERERSSRVGDRDDSRHAAAR